MKPGDEVFVLATHEAGTIHRVDRLGDTEFYWLPLSTLDGPRAPIDLGGPFTRDELRASRLRR